MPINLPDSPRKIIFRTLVSLFQQDPDLKRTISPNSWYVWSGKPTDAAPFEAPGLMPIAQLTPVPLFASAQTETQQQSPMMIQLTVATSGLNLDDLFDLWSAFERAIFTGDGGQFLAQQFQSLFNTNPGCVGARFIQVRLASPAIHPDQNAAQDRFLVGVGNLHVDMLVSK